MKENLSFITKSFRPQAHDMSTDVSDRFKRHSSVIYPRSTMRVSTLDSDTPVVTYRQYKDLKKLSKEMKEQQTIEVDIGSSMRDMSDFTFRQPSLPQSFLLKYSQNK